ncbi:MAG: hypothetical protein KatS3mg129_2217 [Leptospiraceae bacterium]|nr:MAG: hypothetical protein KatS3mg129_2217 [Leptospiraceae bacterium]
MKDSYEIQSLILDYLEGPKILEEALLGMSKNDMLKRPIEGKWSTLEVICHITDMEIVYADRIKRILAEDKPTMFGTDPNTFAKNLFYHDREPTEELHLVYSIRNHIGKILKQLKESDWNRIGIHSEAGEITLLQIVKNITLHIPHHVKFIKEKKEALNIK